MIEILLIAVVICFGVYTYRVGRKVGGYQAFWRSILATGPGQQVTIDFYIATTILCILIG